MRQNGKKKEISAKANEGRLFLLDNLRGFAALGIVVVHYQHFYYSRPGHLVSGFQRSAQPLYKYLWLPYEFGGYSIGIFFVLSGFVFSYVYADSIRENRTGFLKFFWARFARLYPLNLITLLIVALCQAIYIKISGHFFVYPYNDVYHFLLHLLMASYWGFQKGWSFNSPVWSVSIEILTYGFFFIFSRFLLRGSKTTLFPAMTIALLLYIFYPHMGVTYSRVFFNGSLFFLGSAMYSVWGEIDRLPSRATLPIAVAAFALAFLALYLGKVPGYYALVINFVFFPLCILGLAVLQSAYPTLGAGTRVIGDITYATYLLHFPIQLAWVTIAKAADINLDYNKTLYFLLYIFLVVAISIPIHYGFELPAQRAIREWARSREPGNGLLFALRARRLGRTRHE